MPKISTTKLNDVLASYGLQSKKFSTIQNNVFKVHTKQGIFCLKNVRVSPKKLAYMGAAIDHLAKKGFYQCAQVVHCLEGKTYVTDGNDLYLLNEWIEGVRCDFRSRTHLKAATQALANFHLASYGLYLGPEAQAAELWEQWPAIFQARILALQANKTKVEQKRQLSAFDQLFLAHFNYYLRMAQLALKTLTRSQYHQIAEQARARRFMVHRDVAARNFIISSEGTGYLIDFDYSRFDLRVTDLVRLVQRTLKHCQWDMAKAVEILATYHLINPIATEEYPVMLAFLQFPQKFWRLADRYYAGSKSWPEAKFVNKLKGLLSQKQQQAQFLQHFFLRYCLV